MAKVTSWLKNTLGMLTDEETQDVKEEQTAMREEEESSRFSPSYTSRRKSAMEDIQLGNQPRRSKVVNINTTTQIKVAVVQPISYSDSKEIVDDLNKNMPVVVNLEKIDKNTAARIFDFVSGAVYAVKGNMQKVSNGIILVVPNNTGIVGDFGDELKTQGLFDLFQS